MARTALWAPAHRVLQRSAPGQASPGNAPNAAPSLDYLGAGFQDHRLPWNQANSSTGAQGVGWYGTGDIVTCDQVPSVAATANIAALAPATNGTALPLVTASGAGITVIPTGGQLWFPFLNTIPAGSVVIDTTQTLVRFPSGGLGDVTGYYDPLHSIQRAVTVSGVSGGAGGAFLVTGFDYYGQTQTQTITVAAGANTVASTKTFKGIISVVPQFTDSSHNYSVGTADVYGFQLAVDRYAYLEIYWNNVLQLVATFTAAVNTAPTASTGDVRGTFTPGSAADGTIRLQILISPSLLRASNGTVFGVVPA